MELFIKDSGLKTKLLVLDFMSGLTVENTKVNGLIIVCTEKVYILGQMVENMMDIIFKIIKKVKVLTFGYIYLNSPMVVHSKVSGSMVSSMDTENIPT